jgi:hypothetical protein
MTKKPKKKSSLLNKLVTFSLVKNGRKLMMCSENRDELESARKDLRIIMPDLVLVIENFGVAPMGRLTDKGFYCDFVKIDGFSLWRQIK